jgi:hypothetical protein
MGTVIANWIYSIVNAAATREPPSPNSGYYSNFAHVVATFQSVTTGETFGLNNSGIAFLLIPFVQNVLVSRFQ